MKVTWVKGDLSSGKPVELDTVVEYMKDAVKAKPVKNMREMIPYCSPGSRAADAEKCRSYSLLPVASSACIEGLSCGKHQSGE